jgi:histidine ammonia-lyase
MAVLANVQRIIAIELLVAAQALDFRLAGIAAEGSTVRPGAGVEEAHRRVRSVVSHLDRDRLQGSDIESATRLVREGSLVDLVG